MKITYMGKPVRDTEGRFTSFKRKFKSFVRGVFWVSLLGFSLYVSFQIGSNKPAIIKEVMAEEKFSDYPLLVKICKAESHNKQFLENGRVLRGKINHSDIGYCQINEPIWNDKARELGYDIYTEQGNKDMAVHIFLNEGSTPWNSSKAAWSQ